MSGDIIGKIRRLRALSKSSNPNEAAAAAKVAQRLIQEHRIREADLVEPDTMDEDAKPLLWGNRPLKEWIEILALHLATTFGCKLVKRVRVRNFKAGPKWRFMIIGEPGDIMIVREMLTWFRVDVERLTSIHGENQNRKWRTQYALGCAFGIIHAMQTEQRSAAPSAALVRRTEAAQAKFKELYPDADDNMTKPVNPKEDAALVVGFTHGLKAVERMKDRDDRKRLPEKPSAEEGTKS